MGLATLAAALAELVDAPDLGSGSSRSESSSLLCRTTMKRIFFYIALAIVSVALSSCLTGEDQSTPLIQVSKYVYRDTPAGVHDTILLTDTMHVGDTLRVPIMLYGNYNNLTEFSVKVDTAELDMRLLVDSSCLAILDPASKPEKAYLRFANDVYVFPAAMQYVPKKTGSLKISMTLASTAGEKYSPLNAWFMQEVR